MKTLLLLSLLGLSFGLQAEGDPYVRDLVRGIVYECLSDEPVPVELPLGVAPSVIVEGAEIAPGVVCQMIDNYHNATAVGTLTEYRDGWRMNAISYRAEIQGLGIKYRVSDYAEMAPSSASGARYIATSNVYLTEFFEPVRYFIEFIRRQQQGVADVPATIFVVQKQVEGAVLIFILDYRDLPE